jgi:type IV conjugative transfer system protein TraL
MADKYLVPQRLDDPELIGFWTIDEFAGLLIPFTWGILAQHIFIGIAVLCGLVRLAEGEIRKRGLGAGACCLLVPARGFSRAEGHAALPLPPAGRLRETAMRAEFAYEEAQKYLRQRNWLALVAGGLACHHAGRRRGCRDPGPRGGAGAGDQRTAHALQRRTRRRITSSSSPATPR